MFDRTKQVGSNKTIAQDLVNVQWANFKIKVNKTKLI